MENNQNNVVEKSIDEQPTPPQVERQQYVPPTIVCWQVDVSTEGAAKVDHESGEGYYS